MTSATIHLMPPRRNHVAPTGLAALRSLLSAALRRFGKTAHPTPQSAHREAAAVRALAQSYATTDRGFAADLFAAADRHERLYAE